ncbi:MAG: sigma-54 dependent transcriptional regulator [Planctomycetota bacterium]|nr:sigma-54 dependent transcriptional regulator [Planctomycetota bacterium]
MLLRLHLAIKDEDLQKQINRRLVRQQDVRVETYGGRGGAWEKIVRSNADVFIISSVLIPEPIESSIALLNDLPENPTTVILHDTDLPEDQAALVAAGADVVLYAELPIHPLMEAIEGTLESRRSLINRSWRAKSPFYTPRLSDFATDNPAMQLFMNTVDRVVPSSSPLLIMGETGVGKEHLARAIHSESPRSAGPFVVVNCAALPETLLESELFGHEEGAFTGAVRSRRGAFELAHNGTILLDEIGEMPLHLQAKLLRVLQDYEIRPLGSEKANWVDVRAIATTNRSLDKEVESQQFRKDLYYRLSVVMLTVPPLRERPEDVPSLVQHCIDLTRRRIGREVSSITDEAMDALCRYDWPGNIRELMNVIERAVLLCQSDEIVLADLPDGFHENEDLSVGTHGLRTDFLGTSDDWKSKTLPEVCGEAIERVERAYLQMALTVSRGHVGKAARMAGIHPRGMYNKMKKHGLRKERFKKQP